MKYVLQALCYAAFIAVVGYFSTSPPYTHLAPDKALVKLSVIHAGQRREECHERTPEELAKLAPNMRSATVCPRERAPVAIVVEMDGVALFDVLAPPTGWASDGASTVYRRAAVPAGKHRFSARMADRADGAFDHVVERDIDLAPGRVLVIDFESKAGGWVFRT
ncbi:MAG: hypothetical protein IT521_06755 [Burkholderiales bacterium]|nr:hypothetical protein [Burkholderiales bacterium]